MFILNQRNTTEGELINFLNDRICLLANVNRFSTNFTPIHITSNLSQDYNLNHDSKEESYVDDLTDDIDSDLNDSTNDLENLLLDEIEMEHDINVFPDNIQGNEDEYTINNHNDHRSN